MRCREWEWDNEWRHWLTFWWTVSSKSADTKPKLSLIGNGLSGAIQIDWTDWTCKKTCDKLSLNSTRSACSLYCLSSRLRFNQSFTGPSWKPSRRSKIWLRKSARDLLPSSARSGPPSKPQRAGHPLTNHLLCSTWLETMLIRKTTTSVGWQTHLTRSSKQTLMIKQQSWPMPEVIRWRLVKWLNVKLHLINSSTSGDRLKSTQSLTVASVARAQWLLTGLRAMEAWWCRSIMIRFVPRIDAHKMHLQTQLSRMKPLWRARTMSDPWRIGYITMETL